METTNRYAPPKTEVGDSRAAAGAPALWNPNAAANWSLLFTPIFGAYLHMKNWEALDDAAKATSARRWTIASALVELAGLLTMAIAPGATLTALVQWGTLPMLLAWYFASARGQARLV